MCGKLEGLVRDLEALTHPALDALTAKVNQQSLERVRGIKTKLVRLTMRVEAVSCGPRGLVVVPRPAFLPASLPDGRALAEATFELAFVSSCLLLLLLGFMSGMPQPLRPPLHPPHQLMLRRASLQLKEVLEGLLDDEDDMRDMNLSARSAEMERRTEDAEAAGGWEGQQSWGGEPGAVSSGEQEVAQFTAAALAAGGGRSGGGQATPPTPGPADLLSRSSSSSSASSEWEDAAVEVVEALLQAFYFSTDQAFNRVRTLAETIDDAEDYINIQVMHQQQQQRQQQRGMYVW